MLHWLLGRIRRVIRIHSSKRLRDNFNLQNLLEQRVQAIEEFIEQNDDFAEEVYWSHPVRALWNKTVFYLAEYYRERVDLAKAVHFYHKIKSDSAFAAKAYFHLGTIYQYSMYNYQAGAYYFKLAKEKGDLQCSVLEYVANLNNPTKSNALNTSSSPRDNLTKIETFQHEIYFQRGNTMDNKLETVENLTLPSHSLQNNPNKTSSATLYPEDKRVPEHLLSFYHKPVKNSEHSESKFLQTIAELVTTYREVLENDKPNFFIKAWNIRYEDVKAIEKEICTARITGDDASLFELCIEIANQKNIYPFGLFSRNEFPELINKVLTDVKNKKIDIQLHGLISESSLAVQYEELKKEVEATHKKLHLSELQNQHSGIQQTFSGYLIRPSGESSIPALQNLSLSLGKEISEKKQTLNSLEEKIINSQSKYLATEKQNKTLLESNKTLIHQNQVMQKINELMKKNLSESHIANRILDFEQKILNVSKERDQIEQGLKNCLEELAKQKNLTDQKEKELQQTKSKILQLQLNFRAQHEKNNQMLSQKNEELQHVVKNSGYKDNTLMERYKKIKELEQTIVNLKCQIEQKDLQLSQKESTLQAELKKIYSLTNENNNNTDNLLLEKKQEEILLLKDQVAQQQAEISRLREKEKDMSQEFHTKEEEFKKHILEKERQYQLMSEENKKQLDQKLLENRIELTNNFQKKLEESRSEFQKELAERDMRMTRLEKNLEKFSNTRGETGKTNHKFTVF